MVRPCNCCPHAWACGSHCAHLVTQCGGPFIMSKALCGPVGGADPRVVSEMRRLQQRVRDLEAELVRLQEQNDALAAVAHDEDMLVLDREPALTCRSQASLNLGNPLDLGSKAQPATSGPGKPQPGNEQGTPFQASLIVVYPGTPGMGDGYDRYR